jgi:hypothetical protein
LAKTAEVVTHATSGGPASHQARVPQRSGGTSLDAAAAPAEDEPSPGSAAVADPAHS